MRPFSPTKLIFCLVATAAIFGFTITQSSTKQPGPGLQGFQLHLKMEIGLHPSGIMMKREDSIGIFYLGNHILYKIGIPDERYLMEKKPNSDTLVGRLVRKSVNYVYFLWKEGDLFGKTYKTPGVNQWRKFPVDSLQRAVLTMDGNRLLDDVDSLIDRREYRESGEWTESYVPRYKPDFSYPDTSFFRFSRNMRLIPYSFSKTLDSSRNAKLTRILFVYNPAFDSITKLQNPRRELLFEMLPARLADSANIYRLFSQFAGEESTNQ